MHNLRRASPSWSRGGQNIIDRWGNVAPDGVINAPPNYGGIAVEEVAIADYPRVRKYLAEKFAAAKKALDDFEREYLNHFGWHRMALPVFLPV